MDFQAKPLAAARSGATPVHESPGTVAPAAEGNASPLEALAPELKKLVVSRLDLASNKALRLTSRSFRQAGAPCIEKLVLPASQIDSLPTLLAGLPGVASVSLHGVDGSALRRMAGLDPAVRARIIGIALKWGVMNRDLASLHGVGALQSLAFAPYSMITDAGFASIEHVPQLRQLDLHGSAISNRGLAVLSTMRRLQSLSLSGCLQVSDAGLLHLRGLATLQALRLCRTRVTGAGLHHLQSLPQLSVLDLADCPRLDDAALAALQQLPGLRTIDLQRCKGITEAGVASLRAQAILVEVRR